MAENNPPRLMDVAAGDLLYYEFRIQGRLASSPFTLEKKMMNFLMWIIVQNLIDGAGSWRNHADE